MNPRNFLLSTDYPIDKVVYQTTRTVTVGAYGYSDTDFLHGMPFKPLIVGQFSPNASYVPLYEIGSTPVVSGNVPYNTSIESDGTRIYLSISNNTNTSVTLRFNIYAFQPTGATAAVTDFTASAGEAFSISTDYNYTKLALSGVTGYISGSSTSISHGQGVVPQVMAWYEVQSTGRIAPLVFGVHNQTWGDDTLVRITNSTVSFSNSGILATPTRYHYRIYVDE